MVCSLIPLIYHDQSASLCNWFLARKTDDCGVHEAKDWDHVFIKMYNPSDWTTFRLVSTYGEYNSSGWLSFNTWGLRVRSAHLLFKTYYSSHRLGVVTQVTVGIIPEPWQPVGLEHSEGRQCHPLWSQLLSIALWLIYWIYLAVQGQHCI